MSKFNTTGDALKFLDSIPQFGISGMKAANFSLGNMYRFCERMENPQKSLTSVHVAGTNGKGTVCQMLASVYQTAGYRTALYTSPHLLRFNERIRVNAIEIKDTDILTFFQLYEQDLEEIRLTYFELSTCLAFWYFARQKVDIAIIETGLGGRLDATNVIDPAVTVITSVSYDHMQILGSDIKRIAYEKAGIIKFGKPVVIGNLTEEARSVVSETADIKKSMLVDSMCLKPVFDKNKIILNQFVNRIEMEAGGRKLIDAENAAICYSVFELLRNYFKISDPEFVEGIQKTDVYYPEHAHFQKLHPELNWFFDGAHNMQAVKSLSYQLKQLAPIEKWHVFLSMMEDKVSLEILNHFQNTRKIYYYQLNAGRAAHYSVIKKYLKKAENLNDIENIPELLQSLKTELVIFTGSFYFYSTVMHWLGTDAASID
ncbi:MAG: bifunctional folylpolyglutamate synthase/dihydrofolate synthase [Balneolaceae bacterium]